VHASLFQYPRGTISSTQPPMKRATTLLLAAGFAAPPLAAQGIISTGMMMMATQDSRKISLSEAKTPSDCKLAVSQAVMPMYAEMRDTTKRIKPEDIRKRQRTLYVECAAKVDVPTLPAAELVALSEIYSSAQMREQAIKAGERAIEASKTETERAVSLEATVNAALWGSDSTTALPVAMKYAKELDALSVEQSKYKVAVHVYLAAAVKDTATAVREAEAAIAAAKQTTAAMRADSSLLREFGRRSYLGPYAALAQFYAKTGEKAKAVALLDEAAREFPILAKRVESERKEAALYFTIGEAAPTLSATTWLNAPEGTTKLELQRSVTLVEFTAHW
jgi:hypothetical protein